MEKLIFLLLATCSVTTSAFFNSYSISIYGDVHKDAEFFNRTYPWIIDNIGGELTIEYNLLGSGRYSVPQTCALRELKGNNYLQAQYLKCEAEGNPSQYCLCKSGVDANKFKQCVAKGGEMAKWASNRYEELVTSEQVDVTPVVKVWTEPAIFGEDDAGFLRKICKVFGDRIPRGCVNPTPIDDSFPDKKAIAQFDRPCHKEFPVSSDVEEPETTTSPNFSYETHRP